MFRRKLHKGKDAYTIAEELDDVERVVHLAEGHSPVYDPKVIWEEWLERREKESVTVG